MPAEINITEDDFAYAEGILLKSGQKFDHERRAFIQHFETIDLHAVPGSGKTTALLAKLLIIERYTPLHNDAGVLVLSHTNAAVNEIEVKIRRHCPNLFSYPNYIGTIQSFVDKFLTIPCATQLFRRKLNRIDDDTHAELFMKYTYYRPRNMPQQDHNNALRFLHANASRLKRSIRLVEKGNDFDIEYNGKPLEIKVSRGQDWTDVQKSKINDWLIEFLKDIIRNGFLCYDDAYLLADIYLANYPRIADIMAKRFKYVFVDEMQDMNKRQHDLLEHLFSGGLSYQRIGDRNQAILSEDEDDSAWTSRTTSMELKGSHRLSPLIAHTVVPFGVNYIKIDGKLGNNDGSSIQIKPHLLVYKDNTIGNVIPKFAELISQFQSSGLIPQSEDAVFKAIGWRKKNDDASLSISNYFKAFTPVNQTVIPNHTTLQDYIRFAIRQKPSFREINKTLIEMFLKVLRLEEHRDMNGVFYTAEKMVSYLKDLPDPKSYEDFKLKLYKWTKEIISNTVIAIEDEIVEYTSVFAQFFGISISKAMEFVKLVADPMPETIVLDVRQTDHNILNHTDQKIHIETVHSVKGQTHCATLYLESSYYGKTETEQLSDQFKGDLFDAEINLFGVRSPIARSSRVTKAARMVYVGFSRPTHLLCYAVHSSRFESSLKGIASKGVWEIIEI
jgi:DNA helicase-2/ATP-dependent DNA helicase PcrA